MILLKITQLIITICLILILLVACPINDKIDDDILEIGFNNLESMGYDIDRNECKVVRLGKDVENVETEDESLRALLDENDYLIIYSPGSTQRIIIDSETGIVLGYISDA